MPAFKDLTGQKIGRLTVLKRINNKTKYKWLCQCECGNVIEVFSSNLVREHTKSCGCLARELSSIRMGLHMKENNPGYKHGKYNTRLHTIWDAMKKRCYLKSHKHYKNYGGRGIKVCDEWKNDFMSFYNWAMENGYKEDLTIDRINIDGNYCPENCRWATRREQQNNKRNNRIIEYNGEKDTATNFARKYHINPDRFLERIRNGWSVERALNTPIRKRG